MLRTRLIVGLLPLLLLFMAVCVYAVKTSQDLGEALEAIFARNFQAIAVVQGMRDDVAQMNVALAEARQGGDLGQIRRRFLQWRTEFKRSLNDELLAQPEPDRAQMLNAIDEQFQTLTDAGSETLRLGTVGGLELLKRTETAVFAVSEPPAGPVAAAGSAGSADRRDAHE
jgi:hypothetical protein